MNKPISCDIAFLPSAPRLSTTNIHVKKVHIVDAIAYEDKTLIHCTCFCGASPKQHPSKPLHDLLAEATMRRIIWHLLFYLPPNQRHILAEYGRVCCSSCVMTPLYQAWLRPARFPNFVRTSPPVVCFALVQHNTLTGYFVHIWWGVTNYVGCTYYYSTRQMLRIW